VLNAPLRVPHDEGRLHVLVEKAERQSEMGEALTLDGFINACDAELIARGLSDKGPDRGAITCHGPYTLWGFAGGVDGMTSAGRALFVNTVHYAASRKDAEVLEFRRNRTRDGLYAYLESARTRSPGLLRTLQRYLPETMKGKSIQETEAWIDANRAWFYLEGRRFLVDEFARSTGIPNHRRTFLEHCIQLLENEESGRTEAAREALERYTGLPRTTPAKAWRSWFDENRDYLYFSDCDGFRFKVDRTAKARKIPFEKLRGWSSEVLDYRVKPGG
jgi:hypothetical protein